MRWILPLLLLSLPSLPLPAQQAVSNPALNAPLPDIPALMKDVEAHEKAAEELRKRYVYKSTLVQDETDDKGNVKKTERTVSEIFYQDGVQVSRIIEKNGKPLEGKDKEKQDKEVAKQVEKAKNRTEKDDNQLTVSRILELGKFSNPRREIYKGRSTIVADYTGDPQAKTKTRFEEMFKRLQGTIWVDEATRSMVRGEGHFAESFKIGGGLIANVHQGLHFYFEKTLVNNEVWLPLELGGEGSVRVMLFVKMQGRARMTFYDYKKFSGAMKILPGTVEVPPDSTSEPK